MSSKLLVCLVLLVSACSSSSSGDSSSGDDSPESSNETTSAAESTENDAESTPTTSPEVADEPGLPMADGEAIEQMTPKSGAGVRPMLSWSAVAAAASYTVIVYDADGAPWWSWSGADTEVVLGGVVTDAEIGGPRADTGVRWVVMAFDTEGGLVGTSPRRSVEP